MSHIQYLMGPLAGHTTFCTKILFRQKIFRAEIFTSLTLVPSSLKYLLCPHFPRVLSPFFLLAQLL